MYLIDFLFIIDTKMIAELPRRILAMRTEEVQHSTIASTSTGRDGGGNTCPERVGCSAVQHQGEAGSTMTAVT